VVLSWPKRLAALIPIGALVAAMWSVTLPYYEEAPGPAKDVEPLIRVSDHPTFQSGGHFILTSVSFESVNVFEAIGAWLDPDRSVVGESAFVAPGETPQQADQRAVSEMDQSKIDAAAVVLSRLTSYPKEHGGGVLVEATDPELPAWNHLFPGDVIVSVAGHPTPDVRTLDMVAHGLVAGRAVALKLLVDGRRETIHLAPEHVKGERDPKFGFAPLPAFPFPLTISSGDIGGPSAGLMWALGLYDLLTPGDLTGGETVAGTGVIGLDGKVGPIGGVLQKVFAAEHAGAKVFLVPRGNLPEARSVADNIKLVSVTRLGDALRFLRDRTP
jgi:PDZ domain-containing protein